MDESLIVYIERLQLIGIFAGYPLIYVLVTLMASDRSKQANAFVNTLITMLPCSYALTGVLFLGFVLKNLYPDYSLDNIAQQFTYLKIWGLLALLFWLPFPRKSVISLLHSLVFFFFLVRDTFMYMSSYIGIDVIKNDMKVYTDSLMLNTGTLTVIVILHFIIRKTRETKSRLLF